MNERRSEKTLTGHRINSMTRGQQAGLVASASVTNGVAHRLHNDGDQSKRPQTSKIANSYNHMKLKKEAKRGLHFVQNSHSGQSNVRSSYHDQTNINLNY